MRMLSLQYVPHLVRHKGEASTTNKCEVGTGSLKRERTATETNGQGMIAPGMATIRTGLIR